MITIKYTVNAMGSLSGARSVELIGNHNNDDGQLSPGILRGVVRNAHEE